MCGAGGETGVDSERGAPAEVRSRRLAGPVGFRRGFPAEGTPWGVARGWFCKETEIIALPTTPAVVRF